MAKEIKMTPEVAKETVEEAVAYVHLTTEDAKALNDKDLQAKVEEMAAEQTTMATEGLKKPYKLAFGDLAMAKRMQKHIEKTTKWTHATLGKLVAVQFGMKDAIKAGADEDGSISLTGSVVQNLYELVLKAEGVGYFSCKEHLTILTSTGEAISKAMKEVADDQQILRDIATDIATLETEQVAREQGIEVTADADTANMGTFVEDKE